MAEKAINEIVLMLSTQREALNNLLPTSLLDMDSNGSLNRVENVEGVDINVQPSATDEELGQKKAAEEKLSRSQRRNKREANTKECATKQGI